MTDEKYNPKEDVEDVDLELDDDSLDLEIDDDLIELDSDEEKEEEIGIKIKTKKTKPAEETKVDSNETKEETIKEAGTTENVSINKEKSNKSEEFSDIDETQALIDELKEEKPEEKPVVEEVSNKEDDFVVKTNIFALRTTANREDQVLDFLTSNAEKKKFAIYSIIRPHGMRGYVFVEAESREDVEQAIQGVPYARGLLPSQIQYNEIEHMLEQVKKDVNIKQNDIVEIISGPFKREQAKIIRVDKSKEDVVVELLQAAVPIPITLKMDSVKVIRRETGELEE